MTERSIPIRIVEPAGAPSAGNGPVPGRKQLGEDKMARNTADFDRDAPTLRKPPWIRVRLPAGNAVQELKSRLRAN
ncbi:MAG: lipoyl synthase, partial [Xanthomonadales bacterium]|nr:lipoyl synthase [Xanthomonadales bacterium]